MRFTDRFINRPVLAIVVNLIILVAGIQAIRTLSVRQYPKLESATVVITTVYTGANADLVRGFITTPIERSVAAADGIDYIESQSVQGLSTINVRLRLNFNAAYALADISARVNQVRADLPPEAQIPSITTQPSDAQFAAMYLSFGSKILEANQVTDFLLRVVQPRLSAIEGVQRADILGGRNFAIRAWLKPERMASLGVTPLQVQRALGANNFLSAVGETKGALVQLNLVAETDLKSLDGFKKLVVRQEGPTLVRLEDVADVVLGAESYDQDVRMNGQSATFMGIWVLPNANTLDVITRTRKELEQLKRELPTGLEGFIAYDSTTYISDAVHEVVQTLLETILIVMIVIFLFLGSLRTVIVPVVAIPVSLIGAVFLMQAFGFTVNLLTLLAVVLSVGLVVDDAIVVVENVERHIEEGQKPIHAAIVGARELVGPIIAMTVTLGAVYLPVGFQGGLTGALFREFAFTLAGAVTISGVVALTLSPMMCSRLMKSSKRGRLARLIDRTFDRIRHGYDRALGATLRVRPAVYLVWGALALSVVPMYMFAPKELAPNEDQGVIFTSLDLPANASLEQTSFFADQVGRTFMTIPEFDHSFQLTTATAAFGGMLVKPWEHRERSIFPIQEEVGTRLSSIAGVRAPAFLQPALPSAGTFPVEVVIASTAEQSEIVGHAQRIAKEATDAGLFAFPPIIDVKIDQARTEILLDRNKVSSMGLTMEQVGGDLSWMLGGNFVNRFNLDGRAYKVIPQVERVSRLTADQLKNIHITGPAGQLIPLSSVATFREGIEPRTLNRFQQLNAVKISGVATRSLEEVLSGISTSAAKSLPLGYHVDYTGQSRQQAQERGKFLPAMGLALLLIFLVLAAQFNSFRDPLVILAGSVPLAMFGAMIFVFLKFTGPPGLHFGLTQGWTTTLNIYSQVGLVTLVGLISKNAILIVEFANVQQRAGLPKVEAVQAAARTRLRPILMTTTATVAGHFPLTLVTGPGAAARNSIGIVLVGGMAIGTLFTLFVTPSLYVLIARDHRKERERAADAEDDATPGEPHPSPAE